MFKKTKLWRGLTGLFAGLAAFVIFATLVLFQYASVINKTFNIETSKTEGGGSAGDTEYYKSDFGEINAENLRKVEAAAEAQTVTEAEEGAVLLKNDLVNGEPALPLSTGSKNKVSLFGRATYAPLYRTSAACTRVITNNPERVVSLNKALTDAGFEVNQTLFNAYANGSGREKPGISYLFEEPVSFYNGQQSSLAGYKDVAIVMLTRSAGEGNDMVVDQSSDGRFNKTGQEEVKNSLALQTNEKNMLNFVKEQGFGKIIVLINTNYMMELDWLDEYGVDAALFIGTPGLTGFTGVVNVLTGKDGLAPSGRLVDTFAANSLSSPAIVNASGNTPQWANYNVGDYPKDIVTDVQQQTSWVSVQQENIYVGYKYYETRYADAITGDAGAKSSVGSSFGGGWDYAKEMCYPFGFGLSYTTFNQTITGVTDNGDGTYTVKVRVENTGSVAGKDVVQIYVSTPYGDYEKARKIEKPAILFVAFDKTGVIEPGGAATLEVEVEEYLFASYDYTDAKGYVLTPGDYYFAVGSDAHSALNNVLGAKGYTEGLIDQNGNAVTPGENTTYKWTQELDTTTYKNGENGEPVTNKFDKMDINYWNGNSVKYLSRSDWSGTFPTESAKAYLLGSEMATLLQGEFYSKPADAPSTDAFSQGKSNNWKGVNKGITFVSMRNYEYDDNEKWDNFIDQFNLDDLVSMTGNYFGNKAITTQPINMPEKYGGDGCQGVGDKAYPKEVTGGDDNYWPCLYTSVMSCTFNKEIIENRGKLMANQALFLNATVIWTGGGNLHRTPYGGRNAEYYSEDANLCYIIGSIELPAMEKRGILGGIKHFAGNDQEEHREGLNTFYTEQAFREGALRGFEGAIRKGKVRSVMQAFSRQGVVFSSSCYELNISVLRGEWGFRGQVITDASSGVTTGYKSHYTTSMANGTDIYCLDGEKVAGNIIASYIKSSDDGAMLGYLRESAKNVAYALSRSALINGMDDDTVVKEITPAWQILTLAGMSLVIALAVGSAVMFGITEFKEYKQKKEKGNEH